MRHRAPAGLDLGAWVAELELGTAPHLIVLRAHRVAFRGPPLTRGARAALEAARIRVVQRMPIQAWCGQLQEYLVGVHASGGEDAVAAVRAALLDHGRYDEFTLVTELG